MSKSRVTLPANQISDRWNQQMKGSVQRMQTGIDGVTDSPMEKAANAQDKMLAGVSAAIQNGSWAAGLRRVTLTDWKNVTKAKIATSLAAGVDAAMPKRRAFDTWNVQTINQILPQINQMPNLTIEDSINRAATYMRYMQQHKYKGSAS